MIRGGKTVCLLDGATRSSTKSVLLSYDCVIREGGRPLAPIMSVELPIDRYTLQSGGSTVESLGHLLIARFYKN